MGLHNVYSYGPIWFWPDIVMAYIIMAYTVMAWSLAAVRASYRLLCIFMALYSYGPV